MEENEAKFERMKNKAQKGDVKSQLQLAEYHMNNDEYQFAKLWYMQAAPNSNKALMGLAAVHSILKETDRAYELYKKAYEDTGNQTALGMLARYEEKRGNMDMALHWYAKHDTSNMPDAGRVRYKVGSMITNLIYSEGFDKNQLRIVLKEEIIDELIYMIKSNEMEPDHAIFLVMDVIYATHGSSINEFIYSQAVDNKSRPVYFEFLPTDLKEEIDMYMKLIK